MPRSWISSGFSIYSAISRAFASRAGVGVLPHEQDARDVVEVGLLQPREPVEAEAPDHRAVPVRHEPVGEEVDADSRRRTARTGRRRTTGSSARRRAGRPGTLEDLVEPAAGAAVAVDDDDAVVRRRRTFSFASTAGPMSSGVMCRSLEMPWTSASQPCCRPAPRCPARRRRTR